MHVCLIWTHVGQLSDIFLEILPPTSSSLYKFSIACLVLTCG